MGTQAGRAGNKGPDSSFHDVLSVLILAWLWFVLFFIACFLLEERF